MRSDPLKKQAARTRAAVIGYGPEARGQAIRLRTLGWRVDVAMRPGGMSWIHAVDDGFRPVPLADAVAHADVVAVHLPEPQQTSVWAYSLEPYVAPGSLVVFARGAALYCGSVDPGPRLDVVLVATITDDGGRGAARRCRVAVHHDATGRALERATSFARAVLPKAHVEATTVDSEVAAELSVSTTGEGGLTSLLAEWDRILDSPSHEPDQATLLYYERLRAKVLAEHRPAAASPPQSRTDLVERPRRVAPQKRGAA